MEIVRYAIVKEDKEIKAWCHHECDALVNSALTKGCTIVKMVGTMPEPKKMKKMALFVRKNQWGDIIVGDYMVTEERAKASATELGHQLIQWPYGQIIEIEDV